MSFKSIRENPGVRALERKSFHSIALCRFCAYSGGESFFFFLPRQRQQRSGKCGHAAGVQVGHW